jgi:hypothetical protein
MTELEPDSLVATFDSDFKIYRRNKRRTIPTLTPALTGGASLRFGPDGSRSVSGSASQPWPCSTAAAVGDDSRPDKAYALHGAV